MNIIYSLVFLLLFQFPFICNESLEFAKTDSQQKLKKDKTGVTNIVFRSSDGGQTWQDISEGLPENLREYRFPVYRFPAYGFQGKGLQRDGFFANDSGLYISDGNEIYHSKPNAATFYWEKDIFPHYKHNSIAPGKSGILAYSSDGQFLKKITGTSVSVWTPVYTSFQKKQIRTIFESDRGAVFIGCENGLFKSTNSGKTWKQVYTGGWVMKLVESDGVLMASSQGGILRSTDDGENWDYVLNEGGVGIAVERIKDGFAAINYNIESMTRRVRTSYDGGKTWQPIDTDLPESLNIASIIQVGNYFFCGHPTGIFRSSDKGKTWQLLRPSIEGKVFNLSVSGNVIYAIPTPEGC